MLADEIIKVLFKKLFLEYRKQLGMIKVYII